MSEPIRIQTHVRSMFDQDGAVLLDLRNGKYFSLTTVGAEIWKKVEEGCDPSAILDHLGSTFEAPREILERDLGMFVDKLQSRGLIDANR